MYKFIIVNKKDSKDNWEQCYPLYDTWKDTYTAGELDRKLRINSEDFYTIVEKVKVQQI